MITDGWYNGEQAIEAMVDYASWLKDYKGKEKSEYANTDLLTIRGIYSQARTVAMAFGKDVSGLPRKLKFNTKILKERMVA